jgi:hypothetical protein
MEMAPRMVRSRSGNSSRATSLALYTLAPDSLTMTTGTFSPAPSMASRMMASVSRPAVPLPTAMARMPPFLTSSASRVAAPVLRPRFEVHDRAAHVLAGIVDHGQLAAGAQAGIHAQHGLGPEGRREQQLAHVLGEDVDGGLVGHFAQGLVHLVLDGRHDVRAQGEARGLLQQRRAREIGHRAGRGLEHVQQLFGQGSTGTRGLAVGRSAGSGGVGPPRCRVSSSSIQPRRMAR